MYDDAGSADGRSAIALCGPHPACLLNHPQRYKIGFVGQGLEVNWSKNGGGTIKLNLTHTC